VWGDSSTVETVVKVKEVAGAKPRTRTGLARGLFGTLGD
jgi:hypothetical protein